MIHNICWRDFGFEQIPASYYSSLGTPYTRWVDVGMPKIDKMVIDSTFFLYKDAADANAGKNAKGTGFILVHQLLDSGGHLTSRHLYGVTNQHVASQYPVIRINKFDKSEIFEFDPSDWEFHPDGDDIAVVPLEVPDDAIETFKAISSGQFVHESSSDDGFGVGDDVFMVGLFVDNEGVERNNPLARFGNISMMPNDNSKILRSTGDGRKVPQLSFIVDMHSRSGFSGSPVFVYRTFGSSFGSKGFSPVHVEYFNGDETKHEPLYTGLLKMKPLNMFAFLGIHWGQFPERYEIKKGNSVGGETITGDDPLAMVEEGFYVSGFSGMTLVVPAWKILDVLNLPTLQRKREQTE